MLKGIKGMIRVQEISKCGSFMAGKWHRWVSELIQRLMISSSDLLAENYFLISLLGGDKMNKACKKCVFIV